MWKTLLCPLMVLLASTLLAQDAPPAPKGFAWKQFKPTNTMLLIPDSWHVKEKEEKGTHAIFVTPDELKDGGKYSTGLSVNIVPKLKGKSAPQEARNAIAAAAGFLE